MYAHCFHAEHSVADVCKCHACFYLQHGESVCNMFGKIGGDSELSERGVQVSAASWSNKYMLHVCKAVAERLFTVPVLLSSHSVCQSTEGLYERTGDGQISG